MSDSTNEKKEDVSGRDRMIWNVITSWAGYLVFIVAGFVMPRMIDNNIGQEALGIWDFCWSLVAYMRLTTMGLGSQLNRYIAKYRASKEFDEMRGTISTVLVIQAFIAVMVLLVVTALYFILPIFFAEKLGSNLETAQGVMLFLGATFAAEMALEPAKGVITGYHRWGMHNAISSGFYLITVVGMITALTMGGELVSISIIYFAVTLFGEIIRMIYARHICPELRFHPHSATWVRAKKLIHFGGKTFAAGIVPIILLQTTSVFIVSNLGPAALAIFTRPVAIVRHIETFVRKFTYVLIPTVGALHGAGKTEELKELLITTARYGVALTTPFLIAFVIYGDVIMTVWMGSGYVNMSIILILAVAYFLPISMDPFYRVLMGINMHGFIGKWSIIITLSSLVIGITALNITGWTLEGAALLIAVPIFITFGLLVPYHSCKVLDVPLSSFILKVFFTPILSVIPFTLWLLLVRHLLGDRFVEILIYGSLGGGIILFIIYWIVLFPKPFKTKITKRILAFAK
ncbi:MAG: transporter [gamma proteobacterium endosymbiont of Lamellibrachia anaximandri]|nr:transporter [gamma proteobacterium endosymbiont of Lamellibrachia anaximandri]MBL3533585.1 transporter [gamma proteobacterium endosymbiont of Lamellibrachia anaximandri]